MNMCVCMCKSCVYNKISIKTLLSFKKSYNFSVAPVTLNIEHVLNIFRHDIIIHYNIEFRKKKTNDNGIHNILRFYYNTHRTRFLLYVHIIIASDA